MFLRSNFLHRDERERRRVGERDTMVLFLFYYFHLFTVRTRTRSLCALHKKRDRMPCVRVQAMHAPAPKAFQTLTR